MEHTLRNSALITGSKRSIPVLTLKALGFLIATYCLHLLHPPCSRFSLSSFGTQVGKRDVREDLLTLLYIIRSQSLGLSVSPRRSIFPQSLAHHTLSLSTECFLGSIYHNCNQRVFCIINYLGIVIIFPWAL